MNAFIRSDECGYRINTTPPQPGSRESVCPEDLHTESNGSRFHGLADNEMKAIVARLRTGYRAA